MSASSSAAARAALAAAAARCLPPSLLGRSAPAPLLGLLHKPRLLAGKV